MGDGAEGPRMADQTVVLDRKQHAELMALRAQQDAALQKRFEKNVAVMFTDLVGSTAYYERYGDLKGREKVLTHNALLFPLISTSGGIIIKTIGDAIMACFDSVNDALSVAAAMQHTLAEHNADVENPDDEIHIRIALNYGVAIAQQGDLHGDVVNVAARIEHETPADEVYVSDRVQQESSGWPFESVGAVSFKGKAGKTRLYRLVWKKIAKPEGVRGPKHLPARYHLGDMLGHGSIGDMFRGFDSLENREVCIKALHGFLAKDANARHAFRTAATNMARLRHPGVVQVVDSGPTDAQEPYYIMEYVPGTTLETLVRRHGCPPPAYAALIGYRLAKVIAYAHTQNVLHGDLKPENILVSPEGDLRLLNFGLANVAASRVEATGSVLGNPAFMAPEQVIGAPTDVRSDVYSLGALMYYLICGRPPYESTAGTKVTREVTAGGFTPIKRLNPQAPQRLVDVVGRCLSIIPDGRPSDVTKFAMELAKLFKPTGLNPNTDLDLFLKERWPAQRAEEKVGTPEEPRGLKTTLDHPAFVDEKAITAELQLASSSALAMAAVAEPSPRHISLRGAVVGGLIIAAVAFTLGWRMGQDQVRADLGKAAAQGLQPVVSPREDGGSPESRTPETHVPTDGQDDSMNQRDHELEETDDQG